MAYKIYIDSKLMFKILTRLLKTIESDDVYQQVICTF